jgi:hypothetical protein
MFSHAPFTIHEHHFIPRSGCAGQTWQKSAQTFQFAEVSRPEVASKHSNVGLGLDPMFDPKKIFMFED